MSDAFKRHIEGFRGLGRPCPCCVETPDSRQRSRMARARLAASDRHLITEGIETYETERGEVVDAE